MPKQCLQERCTYNVFSHNFCRLHQGKRTDLKKPKNKVGFSDKHLEKLKDYKFVRLEYLKGHSICEAKLSGCTREATQIHHKKGRLGDLLTDKAYFLAVCHQCHTYIENNPLEAKQKGLSLERY